MQGSLDKLDVHQKLCYGDSAEHSVNLYLLICIDVHNIVYLLMTQVKKICYYKEFWKYFCPLCILIVSLPSLFLFTDIHLCSEHISGNIALCSSISSTLESLANYNTTDNCKWHCVSKCKSLSCRERIKVFKFRLSEPSNPAPPPVENNCVEGYTPYYENCFKVITSEVSFQTAGVTCQNDGYNLASIQDVYEQSFLETLLYANGGNPLWIGMSEDEVKACL